MFEAELVGILLALHLLLSLSRNLPRATIGLDNQAAITATQDQSSKPSHYLLDLIHNTANRLQRKHLLRASNLDNHTRPIDLSLHWTPGQKGFNENEEVDIEAKLAAKGKSSPAKVLPARLRCFPLPLSLAAVRQAHATNLKRRWKHEWKNSSRFKKYLPLSNDLPSPKYLKAVHDLSRPQAAVITQLRTRHAPLNDHLYRIGKSLTPNCPHCGPGYDETVKHFLIDCRHYYRARNALYKKLRRNAYSIPYLLNSPKAFPHLLTYIRATKRLTQIFGNLHPRKPRN